MRVILRREVRGVGKPGDVKDVADGYALNYLLPRGLAVEASASALAALKQRREQEAAQHDRARAEARALAKRLEAATLAFTLRGGAQGRVFGSVTNRDIADALAREGIEVDRAKIQLEEPLRSLGTHRVEVRLLPDVRARVTVRIEAAG